MNSVPIISSIDGRDGSTLESKLFVADISKALYVFNDQICTQELTYFASGHSHDDTQLDTAQDIWIFMVVLLP